MMKSKQKSQKDNQNNENDSQKEFTTCRNARIFLNQQEIKMAINRNIKIWIFRPGYTIAIPVSSADEVICRALAIDVFHHVAWTEDSGRFPTITIYVLLPN